MFAEFGSNYSQQLNVGLCRGAATAQNKDWGVIICWETLRQNSTSSEDVMESGPKLYDDLVLAYDNGARYAVIFDYAGDKQPNPYEYGILTDEHFEALQNFWDYSQRNPQKHGSVKAERALVLPEAYGFGFRTVQEEIWGVDKPDAWTEKMFADVNSLLDQYGSKMDIVYNDPEFQAAIAEKYPQVIPWQSGAEKGNYSVLNLNNGFGYQTIQAALSNGATLSGDTLLVRAGTHRENIIIGKPVTLVGENKETTIIDGGSVASAVTITSCSGVNITNLSIKNARTANEFSESNITAQLVKFLEGHGLDPSQIAGMDATELQTLLNQFSSATGIILGSFHSTLGAGIQMSNAVNCSITGNIITDSTYGIQLESSGNNTLKNNILFNNDYAFGVSGTSLADYVNAIDESNTVNGKPITYWVNKHNQEVPADAGYVALVNCTGITVQNLQLSGNYNGLLMIDTQDSTVTQNAFSGNWEGMELANCSNNVLRSNALSNNTYNLCLDITAPNDIDSSNTVNGKPVYSWRNEQGKTVPEDAGFVALANCTDITVQNLSLRGNEQGILLINTRNSVISKNTIADANCGIQLVASSDNQVLENTVTACAQGISVENASAGNSISGNIVNYNGGSGITISSSSANRVLENTVRNNSRGIEISDSSENVFQANEIAFNERGMQFTTAQADMYSDAYESSRNSIIENSITQNDVGIAVSYGTKNNTFVHNNFLNNTQQASSQSYSASANGQAINACDLNADGTVNVSDVQLVTNMTLGTVPCQANIVGSGICNVVVVQRVINAASGGACVTGAVGIPHSVTLSWTASTSPNVTGNNVYRAATAGGPYTKVNTYLAVGTSYTDIAVAAGQTYYYVVTAVDNTNAESTYSNEASATVPSP